MNLIVFRRHCYTDSPNRGELLFLRDTTTGHLLTQGVSMLARIQSSVQTELFHCPNSVENVSFCVLKKRNDYSRNSHEYAV